MERVFVVQTYSIKELAAHYKCSRRTFIEWIKRVNTVVIHPRQRLLPPVDVKKIVEHLGEP